MNTMTRMAARATTGALAAAGLAAALPASAQTFPDKPIHLVIPYAAGGTTDVMARVLQEPLQKALGQPIIVDNRPGAGGAIAAREVIHSKADGYTLFFVNNGNLAVVPLVQKDANYDGIKDFTSVAMVSSAPMVAVVPAALPVSDLRGFIEYAKTHPVSYASAGIGSFGQLATELLANRASLKLTHIPYKGQGPTTTAVIAGEVQLLVTTPSGGDERLHRPEAPEAARRDFARGVAARARHAADRRHVPGLLGGKLVCHRRPGRHAGRRRRQAERCDQQGRATARRAAKVRDIRRHSEDVHTEAAGGHDGRRSRSLDTGDSRQQHSRRLTPSFHERRPPPCPATTTTAT